MLFEVDASRSASFLERLVLLVELGEVPDVAGEDVAGLVQTLFEVGAIAGQYEFLSPESSARLPQADRHGKVHAERPIGERPGPGADGRRRH